MKAINKNKCFIALLVLLVLVVTVDCAFARSEPNPIEYSNHQRFRGDVSFYDKITYNSGVQIINTPVIVSLSGTSVYKIDPAKGSYFWINDYLSTDGTRGSNSGVSIILPKITQDLDKYVVRIQKMTLISGVSWADAGTGTTVVCITTNPWTLSGATDGIWNVTSGATRQSATQVMPEIIEIDATGDWLEFTAMYNATSGSSWFQTGRYIQ